MIKGPQRDVDLERRWRGLVEDHSRSDLTVRAFCDQRNLSVSSFHYWRRELKRRDGELPTGSVRPGNRRGLGDFAPVTVTMAALEAIEIDMAGTVIRVRQGFDEEVLIRVIHVLTQAGRLRDEVRSC